MLLTVDEAAARLGTTARFVRRLRAQRRIPIVKLGKHIRIDRYDLERYVAAGRQEAKAPRRPESSTHSSQLPHARPVDSRCDRTGMHAPPEVA